MKQRGLHISALAKAANLVGGVGRLASIIGISRAAIYNWSRVPAERVLTIEAATNRRVTRHELRPDLYPIEGAAA